MLSQNGYFWGSGGTKVISKGDFIELEYTGKIKDDGTVFDTTDKKTAEENEIFNENMAYGSVIVCIGEEQLLRGLDDKLIGKELNKSYTIELKPSEAFGKKDGKLLKIVNTSVFRKQNIEPMPGMQMNIDGVLGVIKTVTGGRTVVDFNHPLSGREIVYDVKIIRKVDDLKEQIKAYLSLSLNLKSVDVEVKDGKAKVFTKTDVPKEVQEKVINNLKRVVKIDDVSFAKKEGKKAEEK